MKPILAAASLMAGVVLLSGCATNVNTVSRSQPQASPNMVSDKRVITDTSLGKAIRIVGVNESVVSGNLKKVQVTVENAKDNARVINYKFEWTNEDGMATGGVTETWKTLPLAGRETVSISAVATSPKAVDFTLKLLEGK